MRSDRSAPAADTPGGLKVAAVLAVAVVCGLVPACTASGGGGPSAPAWAPTSGVPGPGPSPVQTGTGWGPSGLVGPVEGDGACHYARAADGYALPDPACTPGAIDGAVTQGDIATTICRRGYSSSVRPPVTLTEPAKYRSMAAYGAPGRVSAYELDHLVPLELGGSSDVRNLWAEPDQGVPAQFDTTDHFGRNAKDGVEDRLAAAVCAGEVPLAAAQAAIARDWTTAESVVGLRP